MKESLRIYNYPKPITSRKIRFGIIGCGRISKNHINAILDMGECSEIVAVCDIDENKLKIAQQLTSARGFSDLSSMLKESKIDICVLCTPSGLHASQTKEIANLGISIITEKPMATKLEDAKDMVKICDLNKVRLFVVKQNRFNPTLTLLKKALDKNRFGKIYTVNMNVFWTRPQSYYDQGGWRGCWEFDGGAFMNQASHYVDLLRWLIGPVESIFSFTSTLSRNIEAEDTGVVSLKWRNGTLGSMNVTMLTYPKNLEGSITILGENGSVKLGGVALNEILHWDFTDSDPDDNEIKNANYETSSIYGFGHPLYYKNVIDVMKGIDIPLVDGREGLKSLEVIIGIYLSSRDGKKVSLPLDL